MSASVALAKRDIHSPDRTVKASTRVDLFLSFACLLLVEFLAFGLNAKQVGVYMDEWITFQQLHFVPHNLFSLIATFQSDPRKILRPLECLNMPVLFYLVGCKPFWYHVLSYCYEYASSCFLFLAVSRLVPNKSIALIAAILFLLYPTHDTTHFAIVLWDLSVASCFFTLSLFLYTKTLDEQRTDLNLWAAASLLVSLCQYEFALPMIVMYPAIALLVPKLRCEKSFKQVLGYQLPFCISLAIFVAFRVWLSSQFHNGYPTMFNLKHIIEVYSKGLSATLSTETIWFCSSLLCTWLSSQPSLTLCLLLAGYAICAYLCFKKIGYGSLSMNDSLRLALLGLIAIFSSYSVYALSAMHMPVIHGWFDRVNFGASLGASLLLAAIIGGVQKLFESNGRLSWTLLTSLFTAVSIALIIVNWQCAQPWIISWRAQRGLIEAVRQNYGSNLKRGDSLIVGGLNRCVGDVVVVDLPLELENIVQTALDCKQIRGTMVSERLWLTDRGLQDKCDNYVWGSYLFDHMVLYSASKSRWIRVANRDQFVQAAAALDWVVNGTD